MKKTPAIIAAVVVVVVALVAIISMAGGNDSMSSMDTAQNGSNNANPTQNEAAEAPAAADAVATKTVDITDFKFMPEVIKVKVGDTVTWTNNDTVRHNVAGVDNELPSGPLLAKGETYTYTFTKAGTFNYICEPHPYMEGTVIVE